MALRAGLGLKPSGSGSRLANGMRPGKLQRNAGGLRRRTLGRVSEGWGIASDQAVNGFPSVA